MSVAQPKTRPRKTSQAENVIASKPKPLGWNTTDEDEIALRRWRGETEPMSVRPLESQYPYFGAFCVQSTPQNSYHVEIRHLSALVNSCDCPDFQHPTTFSPPFLRMLCDTPYILDPDCRDCPKLIELENILEELLTDSATKIIIFSEWTRMLQLVRELTQKMGLGAAWHTGDVTQQRRRQEINRFKQDPHCRLFLSTDSGSVGLNLQAANVVINLDLPWNPAKLAQRIARAWRKHQHRHVKVINLITQHSIEHRMIHLLSQKQTLAQGVLHGDNDLRSMKLPSGRNAFLEQVAELLQDTQQTASPAPASGQFDQLPKEIRYLAIREADAAPPIILAVVRTRFADIARTNSGHRQRLLSATGACAGNAGYPDFCDHSTAGASGFTNTASANACTVWQCRKRGFRIIFHSCALAGNGATKASTGRTSVALV